MPPIPRSRPSSRTLPGTDRTRRTGDAVQAVILAAGAGTRLRSASPVKPLTPLGGRPLLLHLLDRLALAGISEAVIVVGYEGDAVRAALAGPQPCRVTIVRNPDWTAPNGVSLRAAAPHLADRALLVMADHLVAPALYARVAACDLGQAALALGIDRRLGSGWVDEADVTRVATRRGRITAIGKNLAVYDAYDTGVFQITPALIDALAGATPSLSDGVRALALAGRALTVDCSGDPWLDIDDPRALALAEIALHREFA